MLHTHEVSLLADGSEDEGFDYQKGVVPVEPGTSKAPPEPCI